MRYPCIETTLDIKPANSTYEVRLWIGKEELSDSVLYAPEQEVARLVEDYLTSDAPKGGIKEVIGHIEREFPTWWYEHGCLSLTGREKPKATLNAIQVKVADFGQMVYLVEF